MKEPDLIFRFRREGVRWVMRSSDGSGPVVFSEFDFHKWLTDALSGYTEDEAIKIDVTLRAKK